MPRLQNMGNPLTGKSGGALQVACVYGDLTTRLTDQLDAGATLDVVDVVSGSIAQPAAQTWLPTCRTMR